MSTITITGGDPTTQLKHARKTLTLTGAANLGQSASVITIFTITGRVLVIDFAAICTVDLVSAGGGTLALGTATSTAGFIAATTATTIDAGEFWETATPTTGLLAEPATQKLILINENIIGTVATADITAGAIIFDIWYRPITDSGLLI